ncbi:AarF/ABC1/UbiB kinase family protein [soil metagenome]
MIRFFFLCFILSKYSLLFLLTRVGLYKEEPHLLLKHYFEDVGGSFIKFGQLLSLRVDFLPKEYSLVMLDLLDSVPPFSYEQVKTIFVEELGATPEKIFFDFQKEPFASGSFGQVHGAKLTDETILAVKVMRPGIKQQIATDIFLIKRIAWIADTFSPIKSISWSEFAQEFEKWTLDELNYFQEAENATIMREKAKDRKVIVIPKMYPRFSSARILTQEYIEGVHLSRVLRGIKDGRITVDSLQDSGIDLAVIPHILAQEVLYQFAIDRFFHGDLHPGNIILLPGNRVALIDFGIVGHALPRNHDEFITSLKYMGELDIKNAAYHFGNVAGDNIKQIIYSAFPASIKEEDMQKFLRILTDNYTDQIAGFIGKGRQDLIEMKIDYTTFFLQIVQSAGNYRVHLPREMSIFVKALSAMGIVAKELNPSFRMATEINYFFSKHPLESFLKDHAEPPVKRMSRERALEQLNVWCSQLLENDPKVYKLVSSYISTYNLADT